MKALTYQGPQQISYTEIPDPVVPGRDGAIVRVQLAQVKELEFHIGLCSIQYELPALLRLTAAGRIRPEAVVTHRFPMPEGANAYRMFADRADGVSKVVLDPRT